MVKVATLKHIPDVQRLISQSHSLSVAQKHKIVNKAQKNHQIYQDINKHDR